MKHFKLSIFITTLSIIGMGFWGYHNGGVDSAIRTIFITLLLIFLEISFSFDNAVVNASILKEWNQFWKNLFLTVGILIAVFGMRLLFPLLIVSKSADMSIDNVWKLAIYAPDEYSHILGMHHAEISAFGSMFLLLVFLNFIIDDEKKLHWFKFIEEYFSDLGRVRTLPTLISLITLVTLVMFVEESKKFGVLWSGIWGIIIFLTVRMVGDLLENRHSEKFMLVSNIAKGGIGAFIYLEILDASFSFDGVIGSFAITTDIITIMVGLGVGAMFVRSITIYLVDEGTLDEYVYLEHGAHYAIGVLAILMLITILHHNIPEWVTGLVGIFFVLLSLYSSKKYIDKNFKIF